MLSPPMLHNCYTTVTLWRVDGDIRRLHALAATKHARNSLQSAWLTVYRKVINSLCPSLAQGQLSSTAVTLSQHVQSSLWCEYIPLIWDARPPHLHSKDRNTSA